MTQCPYPENFIDRVSGRTESNSLYMVWHEGYEAHKFEMANQSIRIANLVLALETKIKNVEEVKRELEKQRNKS